MSVDATRWAWRQAGLRVAEKIVLLSLADRADEYHACYPSVRRLSNDTGAERKTILSALAALEKRGLLTASKALGKHSVYALAVTDARDEPVPKTAPVPETAPVPKTGHGGVPKTGQEVSRKRHTGCAENGTLNLNRTYQEPKQEPNNTARAKPDPMPVIPDWLPATAWQQLVQHRAALRKPLRARAAELIIAKLEKLKAAGHDPQTLIDTAIERGWQTVFEPRTDRGQYDGPRTKLDQITERNNATAARVIAMFDRTATKDQSQ